MKTVTETNTTARPAPDGPPGLEGEVTLPHPNSNAGGQTMRPSRPKLLSPKYRTRIGTWNVRTMYQAGKVHQVAKEMKRLRHAILGVSKTRRTGAWKVHLTTGETVLYSGLAGDDAPHEKGVALILSKEAGKSLKEWEPISERIIFARFESKCQNTTIIQVYAPTNDAEEGVKEDFYQQLQSAYSKTKARDLTMVIGDLNAKVGADDRNWEVSMGTHGEGVINENGEMFCDFCTSNGLVIGGTLFPHKKSHKLTWRSPDGITENQIDHVAINKTWRSSLQDTRVMRSADAGSDHHLVVAVIKIKLLALKKPRSSRKTYCTHRFKDQTVRKDFVIALTNRYDALYNKPVDGEEQELDIEQEWSKIKEMYSSTCEEVLGKAKREQKTWMSENTWRLVEERRVLKAMLETAKTRQQKLAAVERYNKKNHQVKRSCRRDKRQRIDEIAREAEEAAEQRDMKRVYDTTRLLSGQKTVQSKPVKDKNGAVLTRTEDQLNRWKEHFQEVLNRPAPENPPNLTEGPLLRIRTGQITMAEVKRALKSLKNGKAPGCDNIPPEA